MKSQWMRDSIKVLWIEDEQLYRESIEIALNSATDEIEFLPGAGNASQGIRHVRKYSPDLVIADLRLPLDTDDGAASPSFGIAMIKVIAERRTGKVPYILALSSIQDDQPDLVARAVRAGADSYIVKGRRGYRSGKQLATIMLSLVHDGKQNWGPEVALLVKTHQEEPVLAYEERRVLELAKQGKSNKEIASELGKSPDTVRTQMSSIFKKTGIKSRHQLSKVVISDEFELFGLQEV